MNTSFKIPLYVKTALIVIGLYFFIDILYIARGIIIPIIIATIIAILLRPVVNFFVRKKMNRLLAIIITLIMAALLTVVLGAFIVSQAIRFSDSLPKLAEKLSEMTNQMITWTSGYLKVNREDIHSWLANEKGNFLKNNSFAIKNTLTGVGGVLVVSFLIPVYIFMLLLYQPLLLDFIYKISGTKNKGPVGEILKETKTVIQSYLAGLLIEMAIIATLNSIGLYILGMPYAILLGIIGALLNLIPYLGAIAAMVIYILIALVTKDSLLYVFYILLLYTIVQIIDNNFIFPKIVGSKVKLNALATFISVIAGGIFWGIAGMFLVIPIVAIIKVICDRIEVLKPWGFLLGDTMPPLVKFKFLFLVKRMRKK